MQRRHGRQVLQHGQGPLRPEAEEGPVQHAKRRLLVARGPEPGEAAQRVGNRARRRAGRDAERVAHLPVGGGAKAGGGVWQRDRRILVLQLGQDELVLRQGQRGPARTADMS